MNPARRGATSRRHAGNTRRPRITVIAGVNGAGKSSIVGATIREYGGRYFNPDEEARALMAARRGLALSEANARAWEMGRRGLERAIAGREDFTFETTLGGTTITALLIAAVDAGFEVVMRYIGLDSVKRHVARVAARVGHGGHDIPARKIRERYTSSREHLILLLPRLTSLVVYDNSEELDPHRGEEPVMQTVLETADGRIVFVAPRERIRAWARPIVAAAILSDRARSAE